MLMKKKENNLRCFQIRSTHYIAFLGPDSLDFSLTVLFLLLYPGWPRLLLRRTQNQHNYNAELGMVAHVIPVLGSRRMTHLRLS